ncbi:hypothetical protein G6F50_017650 [Rhizopus delemar]|uniref:Uncharacterized protein n=1 Tax=Rhizopus delemar TaxID=936053 RepID=A0A9P6XPL9_9FUNG|nr:hypothetical protein G6F50_017650 [Rhizopus delemar]
MPAWQAETWPDTWRRASRRARAVASTPRPGQNASTGAGRRRRPPIQPQAAPATTAVRNPKIIVAFVSGLDVVLV